MSTGLLIIAICIVLAAILYKQKELQLDKTGAVTLFIGCHIATLSFYVLVFKMSSIVWKEMSNTSHHFLIHQGFEYNHNAPLMLAGSPTALLPALRGELQLQPDGQQVRLSSASLPYPCYINTSDGNWQLLQSQLPIVEPGVQQTLSLNNGESLDIIINENDRNYTLRIHYNGRWDTLDKENLSYGTTLFNYLEKTELPLSAQLMNDARHIYLIKDNIYPEAKRNRKKPIKWFVGSDPSIQYWETKITDYIPQVELLTNGRRQSINDLSMTNSQVSFRNNCKFYLGIETAAGQYPLNQVAFELTRNQNGITINYLQPEIFPLPPFAADDSTTRSFFITSHIDSVIAHNDTAGYVLQCLNNDISVNHPNHFYCQVDFKEKNVSENIDSLYFHMNGQNNLIAYPFDWQFATPNGYVNWHFKIINTFNNVFAYKTNWDYWLLIVIMLIAHILLFTAYLWNYEYRWPGTPILLFTALNILFVFFMLRLFLYWRIQSFPPVENITYDQYENITNHSGILGSVNLKILLVYPVALLIITFLILIRRYRPKNI